MRQVVSVVKGGGPCTADCPFYTETGWVTGVRGVPIKTHCRATMAPFIIDCDVFNSRTIEKIEVTEEEWKAMQKAVHKRAKKERKQYDPNHEEIHPVGYNWKHDRWNAKKSSNVNQ